MSVDRAYLNLVAHLNTTKASLPLTTIHASIAHYLAHVQPSPTPLAALVVSSPLLASLSFPTLDGLLTAFRHAVHIKIKTVNDDASGIFSRGLATHMTNWTAQVLKGLQGAHPVLRLTCCAGIVHGFNDREGELKMQQSFTRRRVEEELVIALAEIVDFVSPAADPWEAEFRSKGQNEQDFLPSTLVLASRVLPLVASEELKALPLATFSRIVQHAILDAFQRGSFMSNLSVSSVKFEAGKLSISNDSLFARNVERLSGNLLILHMSTVSSMHTQAISILADYRPTEAWAVISEIVLGFEELTRIAEEDWTRCPLANVEQDEALTPETQTLAVSLWTLLKTLLFTTIRLTDRVLTTLLFVPAPSSFASSDPLSQFELTRTALGTISHLSFVLPRFGGVSSTASSALPELLKTFYTALDVLASDLVECGRFVRELCGEITNLRANKGSEPKKITMEAKEAFALACAEQLVPVLDNQTVREYVYPLCEPHLNDPKHRETYESAHSVMLAIFSAHAKAQKAGIISNSMSLNNSGVLEPAFAEQIVPAYACCLVSNSSPEKLNTTQLCMAYRALVGCASVFGSTRDSGSSLPSPPLTKKTAGMATGVSEGDAYAWFCIELLLSAIRSSYASLSEQGREYRKKLLLALIATISVVSLRVLPRLLSEVETLLQGAYSRALSSPSSSVEPISPEDEESEDDEMVEEKAEIVKALFEELLSVGDEEKEYAIWWWGEQKGRLKGNRMSETKAVGEGKGKERARETVARL